MRPCKLINLNFPGYPGYFSGAVRYIHSGSIAIITALFCALSPASLALESDRDQQISIESDSAEYRELEGITTYSGNVRMSQGSILLLADEISIHTENGDVNRLVARGNRAYYEQIPAPNEDKVVAQGNTIEYVLADDVINLLENASITQEGATLNGNRITYDVRNHLLRASGEAGTSSERVRVTIPSLGTN